MYASIRDQKEYSIWPCYKSLYLSMIIKSKTEPPSIARAEHDVLASEFQSYDGLMVVSEAHSVIAGLDPIFQANSVAWPIARMTSQLELMMGSAVSGFHLAIAGSALQAGNAVGRGRSQAGKSQFRKKAFSGSGILNPYPQPSKIFWRFRVFLNDRVSGIPHICQF